MIAPGQGQPLAHSAPKVKLRVFTLAVTSQPRLRIATGLITVVSRLVSHFRFD